MQHTKCFNKQTMFGFITVFFLSLSHLILIAQPKLVGKVEATEGKLTIPYEKWQLDNGLTLIIHEDHSDPMVNVEITYHVGSARENIGKSGFAHFFEHMMFQGSEHVADEQHFKIINEAGGNMNGGTTSDQTIYYQTIPSNQLEVALWLESDRMGFLLDAVTEKKFETQRSTVKNEKGQNQINAPYGMVDEILGQTLYPPAHPYSWDVIGYTDDLDRATLQDLKNFFLRWYGPNNAVLTVAGDVNPEEVVKLTQKYFGSIHAGPPAQKQIVPKVLLPIDRYASYYDNIYFPLTEMVFPTVPNHHRDEAALDILADLMGDGKTSVFYKNFIKNEKAVRASVSHPCRELAGEFTFSVYAYPRYGYNEMEKHFNEIEKEIRATIDEFEQTGINDEALQRVKTVMESSIIDGMESVSGKASQISNWHLNNKGLDYNLSDDIARYNNVTKEEILRVFNKYIKNRKAVILNVFPRSPFATDSTVSINPNANKELAEDPQYQNLAYVKPKDDFDRNIQPTPPPAKGNKIPDYYIHEFANGIKVLGTKTTEVPKIMIAISMAGGGMLLADDLKKKGVSSITAQMLNQATKNYSTEQISEELDKLGSSISFSSGGQSTSIYVESMTKNLDATLKLLEEKLFHPAFNEDDFNRIIKQTIESLKQQKKEPSYKASVAYNKLLYGETYWGTTTTEKNLNKISLEDVKQYYEKYYSPSVVNMVIVGNMDKDEILPKLEFLNQWKPKEVQIPTISGFPEIEKTQIYLVHHQNAPQSIIYIGHRSMLFDATGEYFKSNVMNYALGGTFNSRLNLNLREDKGYTYGIRSGFGSSKYTGNFSISTSVKALATDSAIIEIMKEVENYRNNGIKDDELAFTKSFVLNSDALRYETSFQKAGFLSMILEHKLNKEYVDEQYNIIRGITKEEINQLANKNIHSDKMIIVVVGNKYVLEDKLNQMGHGKIKEITID